jgi:hypothetical protein
VAEASGAPGAAPAARAASAPGGDAASGDAPAPPASAPPTESPYVREVLADGPLAYWRLGETSGLHATDALGAHPGTFSGVSFHLGVPGALAHDPDTAVELETGAQVDVGVIELTEGKSAFTLEAWVKAAATLIDVDALSNDDIVRPSGAAVRLGSTGISFARGPQTIFAPTTDHLGSYAHVAAVFDGSRLHLFVNGAEPAEPQEADLTLGSTETRLVFGGGERDVRLDVDEVAVYDHPLPLDRVRAHVRSATQP